MQSESSAYLRTLRCVERGLRAELSLLDDTSKAHAASLQHPPSESALRYLLYQTNVLSVRQLLSTKQSLLSHLQRRESKLHSLRHRRNELTQLIQSLKEQSRRISPADTRENNNKENERGNVTKRESVVDQYEKAVLRIAKEHFEVEGEPELWETLVSKPSAVDVEENSVDEIGIQALLTAGLLREQDEQDDDLQLDPAETKKRGRGNPQNARKRTKLFLVT